MIHTVEGVISTDGTVRLLEAIPITEPRRALVMILEEQPAVYPDETGRLSEAALSDWNRPEEDVAWAYLQSET
jgi:hypothetical protein